MIYRSEQMTLHSVMDVFQGEVNDVMICEDVSDTKGSYYTLLAVKNHETVKKLLSITKQSEKSMECCVDTFSDNNCYYMVFPYIKERRLEDFYMGRILPLATCEDICLNLLLQCMASSLPYPLLELVIKQKQIHLLKDNSIVLGYCMDLSELNENSGEKECAVQCAVCIQELLQEKNTKKNVSYQLLQKKIPKQSYNSFRELYTDIRLSKTEKSKKGVIKKVKIFWQQNQAPIARALLYIAVIFAILMLVMFLSNVIWGDIPFLRMFINNFKQIGTESLVN